MAEIILAILAILVLDGLVSATEAAFFSVPKTRVRLLAEKNWKAKILLELKNKSEAPIATLISLSNIITIVGSVIVGALVSQNFGSQWLGIFSAILTFLIMVFAEIIPKKLGERFAEKAAPISAPLLKFMSVLFTPIIWFVDRIARPFVHQEHIFTTSEAEIAFLAKIGGQEGVIKESESQIIERVFKLNDITAYDLMTPRPRVHFLDGNQTLEDVKEEIIHSRHSRLPVFDGTRDNIIGVAHQRDLLGALARGEGNRLVREYSREAMTVPESRLADDLLRDFQQRKNHLGIVINEHGGVSGVVGLEDVLEELVGEIIDEKEIAPETIKRVAKNEVAVHGQTKIEMFNHFFNTDIKSKKTVNGFLLGKFGRFPRAGETLVLDSLKFVVEEANERAIEKVRVYKTSLVAL